MEKLYNCRRCQEKTDHYHTHDTAHGIPETHIQGSERFVCKKCGLFTSAQNNQEGEFEFVLDIFDP